MGAEAINELPDECTTTKLLIIRRANQNPHLTWSANEQEDAKESLIHDDDEENERVYHRHIFSCVDHKGRQTRPKHISIVFIFTNACCLLLIGQIRRSHNYSQQHNRTKPSQLLPLCGCLSFLFCVRRRRRKRSFVEQNLKSPWTSLIGRRLA